MKKLMLVCCFVIGAASMSFAQGGQGGQGQGGRMRPDPAAQTARLKDALKLTDDQATKITAIYTAQTAKQDSMMKANPDPTTMRAAFGPMREATTAKIKAVLTAEQVAAYDKLPPQFGRGGGQGGRQGGGQGGAAPAPAPAQK